MQEPPNRLRQFISDLQEGGPARQTFGEFMKLLESYGLSDAEIAVVLSRDLKSVQQAIGTFDIAIEIVGWWR
jgi:hypothetical protein